MKSKELRKWVLLLATDNPSITLNRGEQQRGFGGPAHQITLQRLPPQVPNHVCAAPGLSHTNEKSGGV